MKKLCFLAVVLSLLGSGVFAATVGTWVGPTGNFADNSKWVGNLGPTTWTSTSTGDEIKVAVEGCVCTLNSAVTTTALYRFSLAQGPTLGATLNIVAGANFTFGETRCGSQGTAGTGSIGYINQTGGDVIYRDLVISRGGTSGVSPAKGFYTVSGGTINYTSANGRLYVGCGNNATPPNYTEGVFKVVGNDATILFRALWVGGNTTTYGTGTVEFQVDPDGVSPIVLDGACNLDVYTADPTLSKAYLVVSATGSTTPNGDIVLVQQNAGAAVIGTFDTLNGGSAAEGTEIVLGDNLYKLTYFYAANDATPNDIALEHVANFVDLAHNPIPANGASVTTLPSLSWTLPDPNRVGGILTSDVYFGKTANRSLMNKKTLGAGVSTVAVNAANFPGFVPLTDQTWYYWVVDVHDTTDPNMHQGIMWKVFTDINTAPVVSAGTDQVAWLGVGGTPKVINLDGTATDDGWPNPPAAMTYLWTQVANGAPTVTISPNNTVDTSVTITARGTYQFTLTASDNNKQTSDTVQIIVGTNACDASHMSTGDPYKAGDQNLDCVVNLKDFAATIAINWLDCTDTLTNCGL